MLVSVLDEAGEEVQKMGATKLEPWLKTKKGLVASVKQVANAHNSVNHSMVAGCIRNTLVQIGRALIKINEGKGEKVSAAESVWNYQTLGAWASSYTIIYD